VFRRKCLVHETDLDFEIAFLEGVLRSWPEYVDALKLLAEDCTRRGLYMKGLEADEKLAALLAFDPVVRYNLACSYALVGRPEAALAALRAAVELGYDDADHMSQDKDLESIRSDKRFQSLLRKVRRRREKD